MISPRSLLRERMARLRRITLSQRIAWLTTLAVALAVLVTGSAAYTTVRITLFSQLDQDLVEVASQAAANVVTSDGKLTQLNGTALRTAGLIVGARWDESAQLPWAVALLKDRDRTSGQKLEQIWERAKAELSRRRTSAPR